MSHFPFFNVFLFFGCPVFDVADDVQKFNHIHMPHLIPRTSAGFGHLIHIRHPSPFFVKEIYIFT